MTDSNTHSEPGADATQGTIGAASGDTDGDTSGDTIGGTIGGTEGDTTRKDPEDWVTGDEPMTGAQRSYLDTLAREAGEELPADLTKAEASEHIDRLQSKSDRTS